MNRYLEPYITEPLVNDIRLSDTNVITRGDVDLHGFELSNLPHYKYVSSYFYCRYNQLTSLKGCPYYVGGWFSCSSNQLISLEYCPTYVGGDFINVYS
jgi:hypothetical protein